MIYNLIEGIELTNIEQAIIFEHEIHLRDVATKPEFFQMPMKVNPDNFGDEAEDCFLFSKKYKKLFRWNNGQFVKQDKQIENRFKEMEKYSDEINCYISTSTYDFRKVKRNDGTIRNEIHRRECFLKYRYGFFIDLDIHDCEGINEIDTKIAEFLVRYWDKVRSHELVAASSIVKTGRGLGLFIMLNEPISSTDRDTLEQFEKVYDKLIYRFNALFGDILTVDTTITDAQRVCRLPGTYNTKAGRYAELLGIYNDDDEVEHGFRYTLEEIIHGCKLDDIHINEIKEYKKEIEDKKLKNVKKEDEKNIISIEDIIGKANSSEDNVFNLSSNKAKIIMYRRYVGLKALAENGHIHKGIRHYYIFFYYNTLKVIMKHDEAIKEAMEVNELLEEPLPLEDVNYLIEDVDSHIEVSPNSTHKNISGLYWFRTYTIAKTLKLFSEMEEVGFNVDSDEIKDKKQKEKNKRNENRYERNKRIYELFLEGYSSYKIEKIIESEGYIKISARQIQRLIKKEEEIFIFPYTHLCKSSDIKDATSFSKMGEKREGGCEKTNVSSLNVIKVTQSECLDYLKKEYRIWIKGQAGTGKTTVVNQYYDSLSEEEKSKTIFLASTGIASTKNDDGKTVHKFFNLNIDGYNPDSEININPLLYKYHRIIVDEISMLRYDYMDYIYRIIDKLETDKNEKIQLILVGDEKQIPPVTDKKLLFNLQKNWKNNIPNTYFYNTKRFFEEKTVTLELYEVVRNNNMDFNENCNRIGNGDISAIRYFKQFINQSYKDLEGIIHIAATKREVLRINNDNIIKNFEKNNGFYSKAKILKDNKWRISDNDNKDNSIYNLPLFKTMPIIFTVNREEYANGTMGEIVNISDNHNYIKVRLKDSNRIIEVKKEIINLDNGSYILQFPFLPAYAITIHKSQGQTFDKAILHLNGCFEVGQLYVALSRLSDKDGLIIADDIREEMVIANNYSVDDAYNLLFRNASIDDVA